MKILRGASLSLPFFPFFILLFPSNAKGAEECGSEPFFPSFSSLLSFAKPDLNKIYANCSSPPPLFSPSFSSHPPQWCRNRIREVWSFFFSLPFLSSSFSSQRSRAKEHGFGPGLPLFLPFFLFSLLEVFGHEDGLRTLPFFPLLNFPLSLRRGHGERKRRRSF